jgi:hypothetical protein
MYFRTKNTLKRNNYHTLKHPLKISNPNWTPNPKSKLNPNSKLKPYILNQTTNLNPNPKPQS